MRSSFLRRVPVNRPSLWKACASVEALQGAQSRRRARMARVRCAYRELSVVSGSVRDDSTAERETAPAEGHSRGAGCVARDAENPWRPNAVGIRVNPWRKGSEQIRG